MSSASHDQAVQSGNSALIRKESNYEKSKARKSAGQAHKAQKL